MKFIKRAASGMTLYGFILVLVVIGFFVYMGMRLVPAYIDSYDVTTAMREVAKDGMDGKTLDAIRRDFEFKLSFQYADDIIKRDNITFERTKGKGTIMRVAYDQKVHFVYNIDFLLHFDKQVTLQGTIDYGQ